MQFLPQRAQVKQRRARKGVDKQVQIPALAILAAAHGTEHPGIGGLGAASGFADGAAAHLQGEGGSITTIEGLSKDRGHPLQKAWIAEQVPQCGYCQSGMILAAAALLKASPKPTDAEIDAAVTNICRCGTYGRIPAAIHRAAETSI